MSKGYDPRGESNSDGEGCITLILIFIIIIFL